MNQNQVCPRCGTLNKIAGLHRTYTRPGPSNMGVEDAHFIACIGCDREFQARDPKIDQPPGPELGTGEFSAVNEVLEGDAD